MGVGWVARNHCGGVAMSDLDILELIKRVNDDETRVRDKYSSYSYDGVDIIERGDEYDCSVLTVDEFLAYVETMHEPYPPREPNIKPSLLEEFLTENAQSIAIQVLNQTEKLLFPVSSWQPSGSERDGLKIVGAMVNCLKTEIDGYWCKE